MENLLLFLREHAVPFLALLCVPLSGFFLWELRDELGLRGGKMIAAPFLYVVFGLLSIIVFSVIHDIPQLPHFTLHHQGMLVVFPLLFPLIAKWLKKDWRDVSDVLAVSIPAIVAVLRTFCLLNGCCYGMYFPGTEVRIPLREAFMLINVLTSIGLMLWVRRKHTRGIILPVYLIGYGALRLIEVSLRDNPLWKNNPGDRVFALISIFAGLLLFSWITELGKAEEKRRSH